MTVFEKLMNVQQTLIAPKNQYNSFGKYNYRSCEDILEGLKPCLKDYKACVVVNDEIVQIGDRVYVKATAKFIDAVTGESIENSAYARESIDKKGMDESQITGATSSYARKYALNGLFAIDDVKDADTRDNSAKSEPVVPKKEVVEKTYISASKLTALKNKCSTDGVAESAICDKCKVPSLDKLTEKQFSFICATWTENFVNGN